MIRGQLTIWIIEPDFYMSFNRASIAISHRPNGGNNQVCATEFDQEASELRSPAGSCAIMISV